MVEAVSLKKTLVALILVPVIALAGMNVSDAASAKPKPKVTHSKTVHSKKTTTKKAATKKASTKKSTKKSVAKKSTKVSKKTSYVAPKKVTAPVKRKAKKVATIKWPPVGFASIGSAFARVPTGTELLKILATTTTPTPGLTKCSPDPKNPSAPAFACAAILVGSTEKCSWWKVTTSITGPDPANSSNRIVYGELTTLQPGAAAKTIQTVFLISPVTLQPGIQFTGITALCGIGSTAEKVPSTSFDQSPDYNPQPTPSPSATPASPEPSPSPSNT